MMQNISPDLMIKMLEVQEIKKIICYFQISAVGTGVCVYMHADLVLIQTFLLYYVNQVIFMLTSIFQEQFP